MAGPGSRTRVGVLFGGPSREHGVSFLSARCLLENMPLEYEAVPLFVGKDGIWHDPTESGRHMLEQLERPAKDLLLDGIAPGSEGAPARDVVSSFLKAFDRARVHVVFPMVHGTWGEDGVVQGLLEALNVPYVGFGVAASAVAMDKVFMKAAFAAAGLPQVHYTPVDRREFLSHGRRHLLLERLEMLHLPLFVKPSCAGSSVGVSKVKRHDDLPKALAEALDIDARALVEEGVDAREIECSVLEGVDGGPSEASLPARSSRGTSSTTTRTSTSTTRRRPRSPRTCPRTCARRSAGSRSRRSTSSAAPASPASTSSSSAAPAACS